MMVEDSHCEKKECAWVKVLSWFIPFDGEQ